MYHRFTEVIFYIWSFFAKIYLSNSYSLYFSRSLIPGNKKGIPNIKCKDKYLKHIGLYGYKRDFLLKFSTLPKSFLEIEEDLEQLRALEFGYKIKVEVVENSFPGIDTKQQLLDMEKLIT